MSLVSTTSRDPAALDEHVARLVPAVTDLVRRLTGAEARTQRVGPTHARLSADLSFPDGIGRGSIVVGVFRYRGAVRVDLAIDHNRVFAGRGGAASENRCYLNDYIASITLPLDAAELPVEFVRKVVSGVAAARTAVERHRRNAGWFRAEITTARPVFLPRAVPAGSDGSGGRGGR
jgi:hypothetical protein